MNFKNRIGIAGGVDKNGTQAYDWQMCGAGFVEVGTVTPLAQLPNPGIIVKRNYKDKSVWNKMGFPSQGADAVLKNIQAIKPQLQIPLFINIGKNRTTPNEMAHQDYAILLKKFQFVADAFVINISSPNTTGLRLLADKNHLGHFLNKIQESYGDLSTQPPLFIKLGPDHSEDDFVSIIDPCLEYKIDGFVLTNTTLSRPPSSQYPNDGGVSGKPLSENSLKMLKIAHLKLISHKESAKYPHSERKMLISTGGVMTEQDVFERIQNGADLVQVYSTLIFQGPSFFRKVAKLANNEYSSK